MKPRVLLLAVIALATAGAAAFLANGWLERQRASMTVRTKPVPVKAALAVLVARKPLPAGMFIKPEDLRWQAWPEGAVDSSYILEGKRDIKAFVGAVARRGIAAGEPVTDARIVLPGDRSFLAAVLTPDMRAVAIPVNAHSSIAGLVMPGDRVDLILSHKFDTAAGVEGGKREVHAASETVLTNVRVIAIDQSTSDQKNAKVGVPKTATIEVSPRQAEIVTVAMELGKLSFSLRSLARPDGEEAEGGEETTAENTLTTEPETAERGNTVTRDSDVSRVISLRPDRRNQRVVHLMRGSKSDVLEVSK